MDNPKLTRCKDCNETVSNASSCPHCGAKLKNSSIDHPYLRLHTYSF